MFGGRRGGRGRGQGDGSGGRHGPRLPVKLTKELFGDAAGGGRGRSKSLPRKERRRAEREVRRGGGSSGGGSGSGRDRGGGRGRGRGRGDGNREQQQAGSRDARGAKGGDGPAAKRQRLSGPSGIGRGSKFGKLLPSHLQVRPVLLGRRLCFLPVCMLARHQLTCLAVPCGRCAAVAVPFPASSCRGVCQCCSMHARRQALP